MIDIDQLTYASDGTAWKTPSMRGYLFKTNLDAATYGENAFSLTLRKAADYDHDSDPSTPNVPNDTVYYFNIDAAKAAVNPSPAYDAAHATQTLVFDKELMGHILNTNWQQGTVEDFESARDGSGIW